MSQFSVSGTGAAFTALDTSFDDRGGPLEQITVSMLFDSATVWGAFFSLRAWNVTVRPIPGGNNVYVDIGGGAGSGSLSIDNLDSHSAILMAESIRSDFVEPGSLRRKATATFLITG